jgi:hypothetical protein
MNDDDDDDDEIYFSKLPAYNSYQQQPQMDTQSVITL